MSHEKNEHKKETTSLSTEVSSIFVVKNAKRRAFIEQFEYTSINFTQKELGTILGFFIVRDQSSNSENIVNFLASEVKKHYFAPNQKTVEEKFESTLHRVNRALEELANIGNVDWLGTIDGAVCVISDASIHFSVTGSASILLLRDNALLDISEGLASPEAMEYPLKTFVDISSGELNDGDKIIITSKELLELISIDELQKNANRMGQENFTQLIETALTNECTIASATIVDVFERKVLVTSSPEESHALPENFFSAQAFTQNESTEQLDQSMSVTDLIEHTPKEYTDPRTGHIHINGNDLPAERSSALSETREKISDIAIDTKNFLLKKIRQISKKMTVRRDIDSGAENDVVEGSYESLDRSNAAHLSQKLKKDAQLHFHRVCVLTKRTSQKTMVYCVGLLSKARNVQKTFTREQASAPPQDDIEYIPRKPQWTIARILPHFTYIKKLWRAMPLQKKLIALSIIALIVIAPLGFNLFSRPSSDEPVQETIETETQHEETVQPPLSQEERDTISNPNIIYTTDGLLQVMMLNDTAIAVDSDTIHIITDTESSHALPEASGDIAFATPMNDLNLLFVITTTDTVFTFSPLTKNFAQQNNIPNIDHTNIKAVDTYLTYLYILSNNMITRYTRIDNGFDEGKEWLKENTDFTAASDMAINEDIYIVRNAAVEKYFQGEKTDYRKDPMIAEPQLIYATEDTDFVWILDITHTTLYKTGKDDEAVLEKFIHKDLSQASSFAINESTQTAVITTADGVLTFDLK
jgi:hypothetical protein